MPKIVFLWTDFFVWLVLFVAIIYGIGVARTPNLRAIWRRVFSQPAAMSASIILGVFLVIGMADSIHFRARIGPDIYAPEAESVLDLFMAHQIASREKTYSAPLAYLSFQKETAQVGGHVVREFPRLEFGGRHLVHPERDWLADVMLRATMGAVIGAIAGLLIFLLCAAVVARDVGNNFAQAWRAMLAGDTDVPWRAVFWTVLALCVLGGAYESLSTGYHVFGTDQTGNDVSYQVAKSIRTAIVLGSLTTAATLPFALVLGVLAGYLKGWVDDGITYLYTTISSIPSVLLIAACVLLIQVFIDKNSQLFATSIERSDIKLFFLCLILGVTEFSTMCRLIRGETLKLRELDYVQAAQAFGASPVKIMRRHIVPNVMHVVIITLVLEFSGIVLYEAVLSYVGIGVDSSTNSFGTMINLARSEMARDPVVWWNLATAFVFMVAFVLSINLLADAVSDAFDPRARRFRPRLRVNLGAAS